MREEREIDAAVIDGVVFDLDGVITRSESVHHVSWEQLFNEYLEDRSARLQEPFEPFQPSDYLEFVDGKPRYDGVASFLESRDIFLPWGSAEDSEDAETVCGLGNRKNLHGIEQVVSPTNGGAHVVGMSVHTLVLDRRIQQVEAERDHV